MKRVWWKAGIMKKMQPFRERETTLTVSCSAPLHLQSFNLPGSQLARSSCEHTLQNTRPLGNECAQLHILALLIFPALALPLLPPQHTLHCTPRTSFQFPPYLFPLCLYILSPQFRRARKEDTLLPSLKCLDIPSNALGLSLSITPLESLFWSPNVNQIPLTYELLRVYNKFPLQHL